MRYLKSVTALVYPPRATAVQAGRLNPARLHPAISRSCCPLLRLVGPTPHPHAHDSQPDAHHDRKRDGKPAREAITRRTVSVSSVLVRFLKLVPATIVITAPATPQRAPSCTTTSGYWASVKT